MAEDRFASSGTLAVAAVLTVALKCLPVRLCGYSGLMLPPLEDTNARPTSSAGASDLQHTRPAGP